MRKVWNFQKQMKYHHVIEKNESIENLLDLKKINSNDAIKNFKKHGVDIRKVLKDAVKTGADPLEAALRAINKAIKDMRADGTYKTINDKYFDFDIYGAKQQLTSAP